MNKAKILNLLKYSISFLVALGLLWYVFKDMDFESIKPYFIGANYWFVFASIGFSFIGLLSRAARWNQLMVPIGYNPGTFRTTLALLTGYLANLILPRMGEVTRCGVLNRTERVPFGAAFGTVITERIVDLICLILLIGLTFIVEFSTFKDFFIKIVSSKLEGVESHESKPSYLFYLVASIIFLTIFLLFAFRKLINQSRLFQKFKAFLLSLKEGVVSFRRVEKKWLFILHTLNIWVMYYCMTYVIFFSLPDTMHLGPGVGLAILVVGGIGMTAPVQGGIGAFHLLVSEALFLYGIGQGPGIAVATLLHTSQALFFIIGGLISFAVSLMLKRKPLPIHHEV